MEAIKDILQGMNSELTCDKMSQEEIEKLRADIFNSEVGNLNAEDGYNCDICKNKGIIMKAHQPTEGKWSTIFYPCKCEKVRRTIRKMQQSGLKNIIKDYTFSKFIASEPWQAKLKESAADYAKGREGWFFIGGQSGSGKTHLCTAICRELLLDCVDVKYMIWRSDIVKLKASVNDVVEYHKMIDSFKQVKCLYIDDLFKTGKAADGTKQKPTSADINIAFEILNYRYNDPSLLTIISSECTIDDILDIDEAIGGRIFERAKAFSLKPDRTKNFRLKSVTEL